MSLRNHFTNVEEAASRHPSRVAFKIPEFNTKTNEIQVDDITYSQYLLDIERFAAYWYHVLNDVAGIPQRSVIALCSQGYKYVDILHVYGIFRAGYITQVITLFPDAPYDLIRGAFESAKPRAFIFESLYKDSGAVRNALMPCYEALPSVDAVYSDIEHPLPQFPTVEAEDIAIIAQTSGTSSGVSKVIPGSYRWLDAKCRKASMRTAPSSQNKQDIYTRRGSIAFAGQFMFLAAAASHGACAVLLTNGQPTTSELVALIKKFNITKVHQFPQVIETHFQVARADPDVLSTFAGLDVLSYGGAGLRASEEEWAAQNGINLVNGYGSIECGLLLISQGTRKDPRNLLRVHPGAIVKFVPFASRDLDGDSGLLELVIPPEAPECPDKSRRAEDGSFHTDDLFREVEPGAYIHCGRTGDWINMKSAWLCDTKGIENNARELCSDIITGCVVVGEGRPSPVLIVESHSENLEVLPAEIYGRIAPFHAGRHHFERIASEKMVIAVPPGTLPRTATKGTVQRRTAEVLFEKNLDGLFGL
ncbi:hypothetical protein D9757_014157 [Collybiopsis confluens]|uniref:AMP-dependent synthetase/ligase domain-containing protein n=1 Tax=Collybiopsis confluens TaxID=2823264 RepID=A0A8H5FNH4_9AGAR|nr:hypothetical protein D9757_014157 [Collybiopsis confluens]